MTDSQERDKLIDLFVSEYEMDRGVARNLVVTGLEAVNALRQLTSRSVVGALEHLATRNIYVGHSKQHGWRIIGCNPATHDSMIIEAWLDRPENQKTLRELIARGVINNVATI